MALQPVRVFSTNGTKFGRGWVSSCGTVWQLQFALDVFYSYADIVERGTSGAYPLRTKSCIARYSLKSIVDTLSYCRRA